MIVPLLMAVDFMNFNYSQVPCPGNVPPPALIRNGSYSYSDPHTGGEFEVRVDSVKRGSLSADTNQAVVVLLCEFPIGGTSKAYAYDIRGATAVYLGTVAGADWGGDWGCAPFSIKICFANKILYADTCKNNNADDREVTTYALRNGKLVKVGLQLQKAHNP